jgi:hypothetical protein
MPSNVTAKTASAPRRLEIALLCVALVAVIGLGTFKLFAEDPYASRTLHAGSQTYTLEIARTEQEHDKGLSGRQSLPKNRGMLFVFSREEQQCFWMKHMKFPLDIVWTDAHRKVVFLARNVSPDSYPRTYCSGTPAAYVIELNGGEADRAGIHKGQVLNF